MLDPRLFRLRGFAMGSLAITTAFFCMFGTYFLLAQYLQFVHGYTALGSAVRTLPAAVVMVIVSPRSPKIVARFGVRTAVRGGFLAITAGFIGMSTLGVDTPYWQLVVFLVTMSAGMATLMAPASGMIVSSLPLAKAGVGSAVNDVTREVGGAVGIAVMGSVLASSYSSSMSERIAKFPIPDEPRRLIEDSIGKAFGVVHQAEKMIGSDAAASVRESARVSFTRGSHWAFVVAAVAAALGAAVVGSFVPDESPTHGHH